MIPYNFLPEDHGEFYEHYDWLSMRRLQYSIAVNATFTVLGHFLSDNAVSFKRINSLVSDNHDDIEAMGLI